MKTTHLIFAIVIVVLLGVGAYIASQFGGNLSATNPNTTPDQTLPLDETEDTTATTTDPSEPVSTDTQTTLATSPGGNEVIAYHFGTGNREVLLVTGVHGAYSWATAALGYELVDYFTNTPNAIPTDVRVTIIPVLNPDGLSSVLSANGRINRATALAQSESVRIAGRFNGDQVDLNRNFDCEWTSSGTWQQRTVSGGSAPFSEPEAAALRDYIMAHDPVAAVVWFSQEGKVYPSACGSTPSSASVALATTFARAAAYDTAATFDAYAITGDMVNWMAKQGVPAISVLLSSHTETEWSKNRAGVDALLTSITN